MTTQLDWQQPAKQFPPQFQWSVLKLMVSDPLFLMQVKPHLPVEFFSKEEQNGEYLVKAADLIYQHSDQPEYRNHPPTRMIFNTLAVEYLQKLTDAERGIYRQGLEGLSYYLYDQEWNANEVGWVREHVYDWIRERSSRSLTIEMKKAIDSGKTLEEIDFISKARDISMIGMSTVDHGIDLFGDDQTTWEWLNTKELRHYMGTGSPAFDRVMAGGYGRKELTTFIAPPNVGKTTIMCDQTGKLIVNSRRGLYISLEQSALLIMQKIISSVCNLPATEWFSNEQNTGLVWQWHNYLKTNGSRLGIKQLAANRATTRDIEAYILSTAQRWGSMPDFVVIDYADLARPIHRYENVRHQLSEIYTDIRSIGMELDIAMITASQANRGAVGADRIGIEDLAEAFDKAAISDVMIAICQTDEEQQNDRARLYWAKNRIGRKHVEIPVSVNYGLARMHEDEQRMGLDAMAQRAANDLSGINNFRPQNG